jgi:hypothetical protein
MDEAARTSLAAWSDFYVIVGSAAAALTGLQFVVIALVNEMRQPASEQTISAFSSPTVVHFASGAPYFRDRYGAVASHLVREPDRRHLRHGQLHLWPGGPASRAKADTVQAGDGRLDLARVSSVGRLCIVDGVGGVACRSPDRGAVGVGAAVLLMVFIGIHNAWDTVTISPCNAQRHASSSGRYAVTHDSEKRD